MTVSEVTFLAIMYSLSLESAPKTAHVWPSGLVHSIDLSPHQNFLLSGFCNPHLSWMPWRDLPHAFDFVVNERSLYEATIQRSTHPNISYSVQKNDESMMLKDFPHASFQSQESGPKWNLDSTYKIPLLQAIQRHQLCRRASTNILATDLRSKTDTGRHSVVVRSVRNWLSADQQPRWRQNVHVYTIHN